MPIFIGLNFAWMKNINSFKQLFIFTWFLFCIGLLIGLGYAVSIKKITNYWLVVLLLSAAFGILQGFMVYGMIKTDVVTNEPPWTIVLYWFSLGLGFLFLWKWFCFSPHVFADIKYLLAAIMAIPFSIIRLILHYWFGK